MDSEPFVPEPGPLRSGVLLAIFLSPIAFAIALYLAREILQMFAEPVSVPWALIILSAIGGALIAAGIASHTIAHWRLPMSRLCQKLDLIRSGKAPISELRDLRGGVTPVVPALQELLRELRQQKAGLTVLQQEMRQRIAHRTDALERTIGSLRQQATHDPLSGLYNRRLLDEYLPRCIEHCQKNQADLCLLMMDVDHFKVLNDTRGHAAGDALLQTISQIIRSTIRESDVACRCGGDEFIVVLPGGSRKSGEALARRLMSLVDSTGQTFHVNPPPSLSVGIATLADAPRATAEALLGVADQRLYTMKSRRHAKDPKPVG